MAFSGDPSLVHWLDAGTLSDPHALLGPHADGEHTVFRAYKPGADRVELVKARGRKPLLELARVSDGGLFEGRIRTSKLGSGQAYVAHYGDLPHRSRDAYAHAPSIGDLDLHLLTEGRHRHLYRVLGAQVMELNDVPGTRFAVWAPNASGVSVVADFNAWNPLEHPMASRGGSGIWEVFVPGAGDGTVYKYAIRDADGRQLPYKADPVGFGAELRPNSASTVRDLSSWGWSDQSWMNSRAPKQRRDAPISIYEVHLASWQRDEPHGHLNYRELAERLIPYVQRHGFTHIELMPITEHPFDGSWGYQPIGLFAPTSRHGTPDDFRAFVERFHHAGIGVLLDWVPAHFPTDEHGLGRFDGTHLYEHADPRQGFHPDWNTLIFNFGRKEVVNYLISNARFWLEEYHLDGLRVDAVASMLYRDYSREDGEWVPNADGGNQNWEAVAFLQAMNRDAYLTLDGVMTVAEESTAWPGVSQPTDDFSVPGGGLGFGYKWNMGWMNDSLEYMSEDPVNRKYHHHKMTFGIDYAFSENYILPLSHDEVVHGKGSLMTRMPGDDWQRFANLRAYYGFMWAHPGKKLLFMGGEFGQWGEWQADAQLSWDQADAAPHAGVSALVAELNAQYRDTPALHQLDYSPNGFQWIEGGAQADNVIAFLRWDEARRSPLLCVCNFSPVPRMDYRIGVPMGGSWAEVMNTDAETYGGSGVGNLGRRDAVEQHWHGQPHHLPLNLPPLATVWFAPEG
ncbi:MAG: 1,4-alpha-glucan branching protein GlgB [Litorimonas sp.]